MLKGFPITFNLYAENEQEVEEARFVITEFINTNAKQGRAVTAKKVANALAKWDKNPFIKNRIINYLQQ